jgi:hypothetical protein
MECDDVGGHVRRDQIVIPGTTADLISREREKQRLEMSYTIALFAGGCAGTAVDVTLFPVDTIKTRMQVTQPCSPAPSPLTRHASLP